jgi:hypothetical protein
MEIIVEGYMKDKKTHQLLSELTIHGANEQGFQLIDGVIRHKWRIWLGSHTKDKQAILEALHNSELGGHS